MFHQSTRVVDGGIEIGVFYGPQLIATMIVEHTRDETVPPEYLDISAYDSIGKKMTSWGDVIDS